jgi:hypothetical protein
MVNQQQNSQASLAVLGKKSLHISKKTAHVTGAVFLLSECLLC